MAADKQKTVTETVKADTAETTTETAPVTAILTGAATLASETVKGLVGRFYVNDTKSPKAPVFRVEIEIDGRLAGMTLNAVIFAERDSRGSITGYRAVLPGDGRYDKAFTAKPIYVTATDGKAYPVKDSRCADGARIVDNWTPAIVTALHKFMETKEPVQLIAI